MVGYTDCADALSPSHLCLISPHIPTISASTSASAANAAARRSGIQRSQKNVMTKLYTVGELFRGKMLLSKYGTPYTDKSMVAKAVRKLKFVETTTIGGQPTKCLPMSEIRKHNKKVKA